MRDLPPYLLDLHQFWTARLAAELDTNLRYHSASHTLEVFQCCFQRAVAEGLTFEERDRLLLAALFHDTGFLYQSHQHEKRSCAIAEEALRKLHFSNGEIEYIQKLILSTQLPQSPFDLPSSILCDCDLHYLGTSNYDQYSKNLRHEIEVRNGLMDELTWLNLQIDFLEKHHFHTPWAQQTLENGKQTVLKELLQKRSSL